MHCTLLTSVRLPVWKGAGHECRPYTLTGQRPGSLGLFRTAQDARGHTGVPKSPRGRENWPVSQAATPCRCRCWAPVRIRRQSCQLSAPVGSLSCVLRLHWVAAAPGPRLRSRSPSCGRCNARRSGGSALQCCEESQALASNRIYFKGKMQCLAISPPQDNSFKLQGKHYLSEGRH